MINPFFKIGQRVSSLFDQDRSKFEPRPYRDWRVMLVSTSLCILALVLLGAYKNWQLVHDETLWLPASPATPVAALDLKLLQKVTQRIDSRAREFDRIFLMPLSTIDPAK